MIDDTQTADLSTVTLFAIDIMNPDKIFRVMKDCIAKCRFHSATLLTDTDKCMMTDDPEIEIVRHKERNHRPYKMFGCMDHEHNAIVKPVEYMKGATHMLFIEWDSGIINPAAWKNDWLNYDYIGAPWRNHTIKGWPPCTPANCVGNSGFSLRSQKFCELTAAFGKVPVREMLLHDAWMCRTMRGQFELKGARYAPRQVAERFSIEDWKHSGQFGFHGKKTIAFNQWGSAEEPKWFLKDEACLANDS
jgi:hypothetical protein